jgi:DNA-directed RNA polymerase subunit RPC12/RpoP
MAGIDPRHKKNSVYECGACGRKFAESTLRRDEKRAKMRD